MFISNKWPIPIIKSLINDIMFTTVRFNGFHIAPFSYISYFYGVKCPTFLYQKKIGGHSSSGSAINPPFFYHFFADYKKLLLSEFFHNTKLILNSVDVYISFR